MGATVPLAVGRQASVLDRPAPSMLRGISAAHHGRRAAYAMSLGFRVQDLGFWVFGLGFRVLGFGRGVLRSPGMKVTPGFGTLGWV